MITLFFLNTYSVSSTPNVPTRTTRTYLVYISLDSSSHNNDSISVLWEYRYFLEGMRCPRETGRSMALLFTILDGTSRVCILYLLLLVLLVLF